MKRARAVAAGLASLWALGAPAAGVPGAGAPQVAQQEPTDPRAAVLARDPKTLPAATPARWKDFGAEPIESSGLPDGMLAAGDAWVVGDYPLAMAHLWRVLEAEPGYPPALHQLGVLYFRLQRYGDAVVALERFLTEVPHKIGETRVLGHAYYSLGEYAKARAHYELVLERAPDEIEAVRGLALASLRLGDPKRALALLQRVTDREPNHVEAWTWTAQVLFDEERSAEALPAATRARDLDPYQPRAWFLLGQILLELGREDEGRAAERRYRALNAAAQEIRSLESRLEYAPHDLALLARLVEMHRSIGDVARTRQALARLVAARPHDVPLRIFALDVLEGLGDGEGAKLAADTLETVGAEEASAWKRLEEFYAKRKDRLKQLQAGERYRRLSQ